MKRLLILISILLLSFPVIGQSKGTCYVSVEGSKEFNLNLFSQISKSLISQYFKPIKNIPPGGIRSDSCVYEITVTKEGDTTFVVFSGEDLNSYGDSKLYGSDGFQQSLLKSLYRSLEDKRKKICEDYGELLKKCGSVVVQDIPKKVTIPKVEPKVVEIPKKIQEPVVQKTEGDKTVCEKVCEGLVGYYPFNGNAKDQSGNSNHGKVFGAKLTNNSKGIKGSAYLFDGESSYIEIPNAVNNTSYSLTAYVKVNKFIEVTKVDCGKGGGSRAGIITFAKDGLQLMNCSGWSRQTSFPDNYYKLWFQIHSFCSTDNCVMEDQSFSRNNAIQIGKYYLFTISINKETGIASLYQDTKLIDKKRWEFNLGNRFYIGIMDKNNLMKPGALSGVIDEIRIYNKALNDIEVKEIYESLR